jgi:hypothetical protein
VSRVDTKEETREEEVSQDQADEASRMGDTETKMGN